MLTSYSVTEDEENNTTLLSDTKSFWVSGANSPTQNGEKGLMFLLLPSLRSQSNYKRTSIRSHYSTYPPASPVPT